MSTTGKFGPASVFLFVDGYDLIAMRIKELTHKVEAITEQVDGLGEAAEAHAPIGKTRVTLTQSGGFFDTTATSGPHAALASSTPSTPQTASRLAVLGFAGNALGQPFIGHEGDFTMAYEVSGAIQGLTKANATHVITGQIDRGVILQPSAAKTADWNTKSLSQQQDNALDPAQRVIPITSATKAAASVVTTTVPHGLTNGQKVFLAANTLAAPAINGEQTATVLSTTTFSVAVDTSLSTGAGTGGTLVQGDSPNGAVGYLTVTAFSGFSGAVLKIRDSADDSTYADLITFTTVSGVTAERATVAGTVDRYTCVDGDVTGSGSITPFVGLARL